MIKPYYENRLVKIFNANCLDILSEIKDVSAIVTDPPYELGFMGKDWDSRGVSFKKETWEAIRSSCKSGAMMLSFGGTRTFHRIAVAIEDAGWEFRDTIMWLYGSGFPKSLAIDKAIDKHLGGEREVVGIQNHPTSKDRTGNKSPYQAEEYLDGSFDITKPATPEAKLWSGYGSSLKPAFEPILVCMNPLDGTFANNALKHGVAGINIDECRMQYKEGEVDFTARQRQQADPREKGWSGNVAMPGTDIQMFKEKGRFPANVIHDGSQMVMELFPNTSKAGNTKESDMTKGSSVFGIGQIKVNPKIQGDNGGSAARFFYCAKSSKSERNKGCEDLEEQSVSYMNTHGGNADKGETWHPIDDRTGEERDRFSAKMKNNHPTVKPLAIMEYLCKLVKMPEYNLILDPFMGSGTTLLACIRLGIPCIGIDSDEHSCEIASKRCEYEIKESMK